jgi:hypothetical protein
MFRPRKLETPIERGKQKNSPSGVGRLLDERRVGGALERVGHPLGDRDEVVLHDLERHRVGPKRVHLSRPSE